MTHWLKKFDQEYYEHLNPEKSSGLKHGLVEGHRWRGDGFRLIFQQLICQNRSQYHILETGVMREWESWKDGQSTRLFLDFLGSYNGTVTSVDINEESIEKARDLLRDPRLHLHCQDSIAFLKNYPTLDNVDLFYLDSRDVKWTDDNKSAAHHLREFQLIEPHLKRGAIVAIDDNSRLLSNNARTGKGRMIVEYLESKDKLPIYDHYQIIYQF